jgi:glycosyltransferase involved in cell wall biosynthesis
MNDSPSLYAPLDHPYYVAAPAFLQTSGGTRAMHYLCHALNLLGREAYIHAPTVHGELRTPLLTPAIVQQHVDARRSPIAVYPEIVEGNPFDARCVARYLLAEPGRINGNPIDLAPSDLVFTFGPTLVPDGWHAELLRMPLVDTRIFHCDGVDDATRRGTAVFINRHLTRGGSLHPVTADSIEISRRVPERSPHELAELFRRVECVYLYEWSTAVFEALMCGCPVVCILNDTSMPKAERWVMDGKGIAWGLDPDEIARAKATVHEARDVYRKEEAAFWRQLRHFIDRTQARADERDAELDPHGAPRTQRKPLTKRRMAVVGTDPRVALRFGESFARLDREWTVDFPVSAAGIDPAALQRADLIVLDGAAAGQLSSAALEQLFALGKPVVCDVDRPLDAFSIGCAEIAGSARRLAAVRDALRRADAVIVRSDALARDYRHVNAAVHVLTDDADFTRHGALYARLVEQGRRPAAAPAPASGAPAAQKKRIAVYAVDPLDRASSQRRFALPFARLGDAWELGWGIDGANINGGAIATADAVLLDRRTPGLLARKGLDAILEFGKPVIYATDTAPAAAGSAHDDPAWAGIAHTVANAHAIVVPTPYLAGLYRQWNPRVFVLPDAVEFDLFHRPVPVRADARVTVGVAGASLLPENFAVVDAALRTLCARHAGRIAVQFFGSAVPAGWDDHPAVQFVPASDTYRAYAQQLRALDWDIALMPLADTERNAGASPIQRLELAAAGIAIVTSDRPAARAELDDGDDALLAGDTADAWVAAIDTLIAEPALRRRIARTAQARVRKRDALQTRLPLLREIYRACVDGQRGPAQLPARDAPIPGALILDADGDSARVDAAMRAVAARPEQDLLAVVLTTVQGPLPEWTDKLRYLRTSADEYAATAEQLCAMPAFDWFAIVDTADGESLGAARETAAEDEAVR